MGIGESQISGTLFPWFVNSLDKVENLQEKEEKNQIDTTKNDKGI